MSYEYFFHTPRHRPLDTGLIEARVRLLPCASTAMDGSRFYTVAGDKETKNFVQKLIESGGASAVPEFVDQVTIE